MVTVEEFVSSPSEDLLMQCTKDQLLKIAETYNIKLESGDKKLRDYICSGESSVIRKRR